MKNLIPSFIHDQYKANNLEGDFAAAAMFMDISGFTPMTESLMKQGREGAEILSDILNGIFEPVIDAIYNRGGFISGFAGDALTAIFPFMEKQENPASIFSAIAIKELFKEKGTQKTRLGDFDLSVKIGLSAGAVYWGIAGSRSRKTYFFRGPAIDNCARAEHQCNKMDIVLDEKVVRILQSAGLNLHCETIKEMDDTYFRLVSVKDTPPSGATNEAFSGQALYPLSRGEGDEMGILAKEVISIFVPDAIVSRRYQGEFRNIVSVFISFVKPDRFLELNEFVSNVLNEVETYGGYFNSLDFGDKGGAMLVFFGAPVSYEDSIKRAISFLLRLKRKYKKMIRAGVTQGTAYAGFVGSERRCAYTCLGDVVNMSARLMMKADFGKVWITEEIKKKTEREYNTKDSGCKELKGVSSPVRVFELLSEKAAARTTPKLYECEMVSREAELEKLEGYCQPILEGKFGGVVYVYGEAGIGKSRLLYELTEKLKTDYGAQICTLQTDGMLKKGLNPFVYFFNDYFNQYQETALDKRKAKFEDAYDRLIEELKSSLKTVEDPHQRRFEDPSAAGRRPWRNEQEIIIKEITRIKPIIGAVLGLRWEGSIYENIDPKDWPEVIRFAIKEFFKALSWSGPVVLLLEDMHWLDNESQNVFEIFTRQMEYYPIIILAASRLNDDGSKTKLIIDKDSLQNEMTLGNLPVESVELFVRNQFKNKADDDLQSFVFHRTEGNPFYMEQFCLYLEENLLIALEDGIYKLKKAIADVPVSINAILNARIDRLSVELKEMAQAASVLGREFEVQILLELIKTMGSSAAKDGREQAEDERLEHLLSAGITERVWNVLSEIKYIFKHALLRDAVYEMQLKARLRNLHKIAGEAMEKLYPEDKTRYSDIAYHCDKAEQKEKAKDYYFKAGDYAQEIYQMDQSIECYNNALALCIGLYGDRHVDTAKSYNNIGTVYLDKGEYDKALENYNKAFVVRFELFGEKHHDTAQSYNNIGGVYNEKGDYDTALKYYNKAFAIWSEIFGEKHPDSARAYINIGGVYFDKGDYDTTLEYYNKAFAIWSEILGEKHHDTATAYNNIGMVYWHKGDYDKALEYLNKGLAILREIFGEKHQHTATSYNNIGCVYSNKGEYDTALEYYNKAFAIRIEILGEKHPDTAVSYNNIGDVYLNKGDYDKASEYNNKAFVIRIEMLGEKHLHTASSYYNIGKVHLKKVDYDMALEYFNKALAVFIKILGERHPHIAISYNNIGKAYKGKGDLGKAMECYNKALEIYKEMKNEKGLAEVVKNIEEMGNSSATPAITSG